MNVGPGPRHQANKYRLVIGLLQLNMCVTIKILNMSLKLLHTNLTLLLQTENIYQTLNGLPRYTPLNLSVLVALRVDAQFLCFAPSSYEEEENLIVHMC